MKQTICQSLPKQLIYINKTTEKIKLHAIKHVFQKKGITFAV